MTIDRLTKAPGSRRDVLKTLTGLAAGAAAWALPASSVNAQAAYPNKLVRIVVGFPAGGPSDLAARVLAEQLSRTLGQTFMIENRAGANATIATEAVSRATPDGYTLLMAAGNHTINPALYTNLKFDTEKAFSPVAISAVSPNVLVVNSAFPARTLAEFLKVVRAAPGKYTYGSSGNGGTVHLAGEIFKSVTKTFIVHVPYRGAAPALTDLLGGQIDMSFASLGSVLPQIRSGRLHAIAMASQTRSVLMPEVPTFVESGLKNCNMETWYGLLAPAGTPSAIVDLLGAAIAKTPGATGVREKLASAGIDATYVGPDAFTRQIQSELALYAKVVRENHLTID